MPEWVKKEKKIEGLKEGRREKDAQAIAVGGRGEAFTTDERENKEEKNGYPGNTKEGGIEKGGRGEVASRLV